MRRLGGALVALLLSASAALAQGSTINTGVPANGAPLQSAPIRNNFVAAANDINNILSMFAGTSAPAHPVTFQQWANPGVNPAPISLYDGTQFVTFGFLDRIAHTYAPALSTSTLLATPPITVGISAGVATIGIGIDSNFAVSSNNLVLNSINAGWLLANCTNAFAEPTGCSWNSFASQAIGNTNGMLPYRTGGAWGTISTGTSGGTIPLNNTANVFSAAQTIDLNTGALQSPQTGAALQVGNANGVISRVENDAYANVAVFTGVRADGTAASPTTLQTNDEISSMSAFGYNGSAFVGGTARVSIFAAQNWSVGANGSYIRFGTTANGAAAGTPVDRVSIENDGGVTVPPAVTGGSKGSGTINAQGLYINGAAVSAAAGNLTVGTSVVTGGPGILYNTTSGGTLTALAAVNSSVVSFTSGGVLQASTTLPSGIAATNMALTTPALGVATATSLAVNGCSLGGAFLCVNGNLFAAAINASAAMTVTSASGSAFAVGPNGSTNPTFSVDGSAGSAANGIKIAGAATGGTANIFVTDSSSNSSLAISAKGTGTITLGSLSTGAVTITPPTTLSAALTYGGVTLSNSVSGTGSMALTAGTTFTGTTTVATLAASTITGAALSGTFTGNATFSGNVTHSGQLIATGTSAPASAAGNTVIMGTMAAPTLTNTGQAFLYNESVYGIIVQGDGGTCDVSLFNKNAVNALCVSTGTANVLFGGGITATLANSTGLPISTGISGLGSGFTTAAAIAVNASGGFPTVGNVLTSLTPGAGLVSSTTVNFGVGQAAITTTGTLSSAHGLNPQSGTTYTILDSDRAKEILATNAAAQAYSIAQAGTGGIFQAGWYVDIENNSTNVAGVITITPTTSQICAAGVCAATYKIQPGGYARILSDATNYQVILDPLGSQLYGTTTNDNACAGCVGEIIQSDIESGSAVSLTSTTVADITTISLTAGDWDVEFIPKFTGGASTTITYLEASISQTANTTDRTNGRSELMWFNLGTAFNTGPGYIGLGGITVRESLSTTTTIHAVANTVFGVSTLSGYGLLRARRVR